MDYRFDEEVKGCIGIYIYELEESIKDKKLKKSFNYTLNELGGNLSVPDNGELSPLYVGSTGRSINTRVDQHLNGIKSGQRFITNFGVRRNEEWPKGIRLDLMEEVPSNLRIPSSQRLDYEISTAFEMAMRGHIVFGPKISEIENKSEWPYKHEEIWSG